MTTVRQLITGALRLINVVQANEVPTAEDMNISIASMTGLLDSWSAESLMIFLMKQYYFPTYGGVKDYTLGAGGDWDLARPMAIEKITVSLNAGIYYDNGYWKLTTTNSVLDIPMEGLTDAQYAALPVKNQTAPYPLKYYDNGDYPLRTISVWPIPTTNQPLTLWLRQPLDDPQLLDDDIQFPRGYERALRFSLAIEMSSEFGKDVPKDVMRIATESKAYLKRINSRNQIMRNDIAILQSGPGVYNWDLSTTIPN
jgi:hypothetical protein